MEAVLEEKAEDDEAAAWGQLSRGLRVSVLTITLWSACLTPLIQCAVHSSGPESGSSKGQGRFANSSLHYSRSLNLSEPPPPGPKQSFCLSLLSRWDQRNSQLNSYINNSRMLMRHELGHQQQKLPRCSSPRVAAVVCFNSAWTELALVPHPSRLPAHSQPSVTSTPCAWTTPPHHLRRCARTTTRIQRPPSTARSTWSSTSPMFACPCLTTLTGLMWL
ncbi:uncharacterized protein LOC128929808 isoform X3 [Callithrix jacchus]